MFQCIVCLSVICNTNFVMFKCIDIHAWNSLYGYGRGGDCVVWEIYNKLNLNSFLNI